MSRRRSWSDVTASEARDLFDAYVARHPARVASLLDTVRARGGPIDALDFSRESLGPLWTWVMATEQPPPVPATDAEMLAADPPWWYEFHVPLGQQIGPELADLVTLVAAYLAETIMRRRPGSTWVIGTDRRGADFRQPLLRVAGRGEFLPDAILLVMANQWATNLIVSNDRLLDVYDTRAGPEPNVASTPELVSDADSTPYHVERAAMGDLETVVSFDDATAHEESERIDRFVDALRREPGVDRAVREDREIVLIGARRIDDATVTAMIRRIWDGLA